MRTLAHDWCSNWKWPDAPGLEDFKGDLMHSAKWPENFDHTGKVVAVIVQGLTPAERGTRGVERSAIRNVLPTENGHEITLA